MTKKSTFPRLTLSEAKEVSTTRSHQDLPPIIRRSTPEQTSLLQMLLQGWDRVPHYKPLLEITTFHQARGRYWNPSTRRRSVSHCHWHVALIQSDAAAGIDKELPWWVWELITYQSAACCLNIQNSPPRAIFSRELLYLTDVPNEWNNHFLS